MEPFYGPKMHYGNYEYLIARYDNRIARIKSSPHMTDKEKDAAIQMYENQKYYVEGWMFKEQYFTHNEHVTERSMIQYDSLIYKLKNTE